MQPTCQNRPDSIQSIRLGRFLRVGGLGWVVKFVFTIDRVRLGL